VLSFSLGLAVAPVLKGGARRRCVWAIKHDRTPPLVVAHRVRRVTGAKLLVALLVFGCGRRATRANGVEASLGRCVVGAAMVGGWCWCLVEAWTT
jgi:hypothetical protein